MELVNGRSPAELIRAAGLVAVPRAAEIGLRVLDALRAAHQQGVLHRDVKPANILIAAGAQAHAGGRGHRRTAAADLRSGLVGFLARPRRPGRRKGQRRLRAGDNTKVSTQSFVRLSHTP
jgi:serine/threonine protein kinase